MDLEGLVTYSVCLHEKEEWLSPEVSVHLTSLPLCHGGLHQHHILNPQIPTDISKSFFSGCNDLENIPMQQQDQDVSISVEWGCFNRTLLKRKEDLVAAKAEVGGWC